MPRNTFSLSRGESKTNGLFRITIGWIETNFGGSSLPSNSNNYGDFDRDKTIYVRMYLKFRYHPISSCDQKGKQPSKHKFSTINLSGQPWCIFNKITFLNSYRKWFFNFHSKWSSSPAFFVIDPHYITHLENIQLSQNINPCGSCNTHKKRFLL